MPFFNFAVLINGDSTLGGFFTLAVLSDNARTPGSLIASGTFSDSLLNTALTNTPGSAGVSLAANTRYWLQFQ